MLEEGEPDAEGEVVVGTPAGETSGAGADVNMDCSLGRALFAHGPQNFRLLYLIAYSELPSGGWVE
jgi:hypothetical protein